MVFEVIFFFISVLLLGATLLARDAVHWWRSRRRGPAMTSLLNNLQGCGIERAESVLGEPTEVVSGLDGRLLYVWKAANLHGVPQDGKLLIVTLTTDRQGIVTRAAWEQR